MRKLILQLLFFAVVMSLVLAGCAKTVSKEPVPPPPALPEETENPIPPQPPQFEGEASAESKEDLQPPALPEE